MEKQFERTREPEPQLDHYDAMRARWQKMIEGYKNGKRVVKFSEIMWEQNKQAIIKRYADPLHPQDVAAPFWLAFMHHIKKHSGKHTHQGGLPIYVVEGRGYSVVDGVRYDWKKGDLLLLPIKPGGVEHQHFSDNPDEPARWIAIRWYPLLDFLANTTEQNEVHPDWAGKK